MEATMIMPPAVQVAERTDHHPGYKFEGDWDPRDQRLIEGVMVTCLPAEISPVFDTWKLLCYMGRFIARRLTWEIGGNSIYARDVLELAQALLAYHGKG